MTHRITYTVCGKHGATVEATYSEADFMAMFSAGDRADLLAGKALIAKSGPDSAWPRDVRIERHQNPSRQIAMAAPRREKTVPQVARGDLFGEVQP